MIDGKGKEMTLSEETLQYAHLRKEAVNIASEYPAENYSTETLLERADKIYTYIISGNVPAPVVVAGNQDMLQHAHTCKCGRHS